MSRKVYLRQVMRKWINLYFDLSKREFNGLLVMIMLIGIVTAAPYLYERLRDEPDQQVSDEMAIKKLMDQLQSEKRPLHYRGSKGHSFGSKRTLAHKAELFVFDPNLISGAEWQRLGLSEKQAASILKYRSKGGRFRKNEDLQKMYTISPFMYQRIEPYIRITAIPETDKDFNYTKSVQSALQEKKLVRIELNAADSAGICEVNGIGPVFAGRIIRYRQRLGGFCKITQLMEVYGLDSLKYAGIHQQITIDDRQIKTININTAEFADLRSHPYLRYKQINALLQYRKQHGNYGNIADLNKVLALDAETIARISPYLVF